LAKDAEGGAGIQRPANFQEARYPYDYDRIRLVGVAAAATFFR